MSTKVYFYSKVSAARPAGAEENNMKEEKRDVPAALKYVLSKDVALTNYFIDITKNNSVFASLRIHHRLLEVSCNGILWLSLCIGSIWLFAIESFYQTQANLLIALIFDIILVAILKASTRRRRPSAPYSTDIGPDKFSFPSGHASRAAFIAYIFLFISPIPILCYPPIFAWVSSVCLSRVLSQRHYILDVIGGVTIGILEGIVFSWIWLSEDLSHYLINYLSDEKLFGGEYHV